MLGWTEINKIANVEFPLRRGHSLLAIDDYIILFGGRTVNNYTEHMPHSINVENACGEPNITTYNKKNITDCTDEVPPYYDTCTRHIYTTQYHNDIWKYDLTCYSKLEDKTKNESCGWEVVDDGAFNGGCTTNTSGVFVCTHPYSRSEQTAVIAGEYILFYMLLVI